MSILVNLLPDVRQAKLREHRRRQLVTGVSILVWLICGGIVAILAVYEVGQKAVIYGTTQDILKNENTLKSMSGLTDALTASDQAQSLPGLYSGRTFYSKFFSALEAATPGDVQIATLTTDDQGDLTINGSSTTYSEVAKLARAMADDNVTVGQGAATGNTPYFTNVNIQNLGSSNGTVSFTITATMDPSVTSEVGANGQ